MIDKQGKIVKSIFEELDLEEISAVDVPAMSGATMSIMKRALPFGEEEEEGKPKKKKAEKGVPDSTDASKTNSGESADTVGNVPNEVTMTTKNEKTVDDTAVAKQLAEVTKRAERAEKVSELTDAQKGIFKSLEGDAQDMFLASTPEQRDAEVAKAAESNAVVYKSMSGEEFRKNDDPRLISMAKRDDEKTRKLGEMEEEAKKADLQKRASEFGNLPGSAEVVVSLLKAIDGLPEAERAPALEALKAQDAGLEKAFKRSGTSEVPTELNPLNDIAKRLRVEDPSLTQDAAIAKALGTPEGAEAYAKSRSL